MRSIEKLEQDGNDRTARLVSATSRRDDRFLAFLVLAAYLVSVSLPLSSLNHCACICAFRAVTGLPCPGCGMTHAFLCLGHGNIAAAWRYNALSLPLYVAGLVWLTAWVTGLRLDLHLPHRVKAALMMTVLTGTVCYGVYRILVPAARPF